MARKVSVLLICSLLLLLTGCGGSEKHGSTEGRPWELFTQEEAEQVLGFEVEPEIQKIDPVKQRIVFYGAASEKETGFIQLSVARNVDMEESLKKQGYNVKQLFEETKKALSDSPQPVKGFGDEAFWITGSTDALHILTDGIYVTISTNHGDSFETLELTKGVAEKVLSRLKSVG